jgi:4-amino-4-deoxy-L-arabinose transferase-like glycosyltransferase
MTGAPDARARHPLVAWPVIALAALTVVALLALGQAYGFHRDELYFIVAGRHPALGYADQPPITPLLSAGAVALLGLEPFALRILPAIAVGACVVLAAAIAREMGGSRRAQVLAALTLAASGYLAAGHIGVTATYDLVAWAVVLWLTTRLLGGGDRRLWLLVGVVAGIGLLNKHLVLFLVGGIFVGLAANRRDLLRSPWPWLGAAVALLIWSPNLAWQAANGFPQLAMARSIGGDGLENRLMLLPELLLLAGPLLFPVSMLGLWRLLRDPRLRPFRPLGTAFLAILAVVLVAGGKSYYVAGALPVLMAAGAIGIDGWLRASRPRLASLGLATAGSLALVAVLTLPVLPAASLAGTPIPDLYPENAEQVGWPELVGTVRSVVDALPAGERERAVILTANYGEQGALELLGGDLPPAYSGHNSLWDWGPLPDDHDVVVLVGWWSQPWYSGLLGSCERVATIDNAAGMPNQEQGAGVAVCTTVQPWSRTWPRFRHLD